MPKTKSIVINTGPLLALIAGYGDLSFLKKIYQRVLVPFSENIRTVCIDEAVGRRIARLNGLCLTGSIGVLLRAKRKGIDFSIPDALNGMQSNGIYLSKKVIDFALRY
jgi:predicted nucleic acid-binding protein